MFGQTCLGVSESIERIAFGSLDDIEGVERVVCGVRFFDLDREDVGDAARDRACEDLETLGGASSGRGDSMMGPGVVVGSKLERRGSSKYPVPSQSQFPLTISTVRGPSSSSSGQ